MVPYKQHARQNALQLQQAFVEAGAEVELLGAQDVYRGDPALAEAEVNGPFYTQAVKITSNTVPITPESTLYFMVGSIEMWGCDDTLFEKFKAHPYPETNAFANVKEFDVFAVGFEKAIEVLVRGWVDVENRYGIG